MGSLETRKTAPASTEEVGFKKASGIVVQITLRAVPATATDPSLNHARLRKNRDLEDGCSRAVRRNLRPGNHCRAVCGLIGK